MGLNGGVVLSIGCDSLNVMEAGLESTSVTTPEKLPVVQLPLFSETQIGAYEPQKDNAIHRMKARHICQ